MSTVSSSGKRFQIHEAYEEQKAMAHQRYELELAQFAVEQHMELEAEQAKVNDAGLSAFQALTEIDCECRAARGNLEWYEAEIASTKRSVHSLTKAKWALHWKIQSERGVLDRLESQCRNEHACYEHWAWKHGDNVWAESVWNAASTNGPWTSESAQAAVVDLSGADSSWEQCKKGPVDVAVVPVTDSLSPVTPPPVEAAEVPPRVQQKVSPVPEALPGAELVQDVQQTWGKDRDDGWFSKSYDASGCISPDGQPQTYIPRASPNNAEPPFAASTGPLPVPPPDTPNVGGQATSSDNPSVSQVVAIVREIATNHLENWKNSEKMVRNSNDDWKKKKGNGRSNAERVAGCTSLRRAEPQAGWHGGNGFWGRVPDESGV